jgi:hypothetical protein
MQFLKETVTGWREIQCINSLHMDHSVKLRLDQGETRCVKIRIGVRQGCCFSRMQFELYRDCFTKQILEVFGDFEIGL